MGLFFIQKAWAALPIERWTTEQGVQINHVYSPGIPMVDVQIDFDAGSRRDPAAQAGLAGATAAMLSKSIEASDGQPALDENALGEAWADLGASFVAHADNDRFSVSLRSLSEPALLDAAAALAARTLAHPAFDATVWQRQRQTWIAALKESETRPATVAQRAFDAAVYGRHPYGQHPTPETLAHIEVQHLRQFYAQHLLPCRARVSVVGALDRARAQQLVHTLLAPLQRRHEANVCPALPPLLEVAPLVQPSEQWIAFAAAQAHILIGQPGVARRDPDYLALIVGNYILGGGGFVSRLTTQVRERRGLSYSVYSAFSAGKHAGAFSIGLQTRPDQAEQALAVVREVLRDYVTQGPTPAELEAAKANLVGGFALRLDSNRKLLDNVANMAWNDLPIDYLDTWTERVQRLSVADIHRAMARVLSPERMVTVVVGGVGPRSPAQARAAAPGSSGQP
ncbi:MAG: pitrilysin family protein [Rhodoferax sp.]